MSESEQRTGLVLAFAGALGMAALGYALLSWNVGMSQERLRRLSLGAKW